MGGSDIGRVGGVEKATGLLDCSGGYHFEMHFHLHVVLCILHIYSILAIHSYRLFHFSLCMPQALPKHFKSLTIVTCVTEAHEIPFFEAPKTGITQENCKNLTHLTGADRLDKLQEDVEKLRKTRN